MARRGRCGQRALRLKVAARRCERFMLSLLCLPPIPAQRAQAVKTARCHIPSARAVNRPPCALPVGRRFGVELLADFAQRQVQAAVAAWVMRSSS